MTGYDPLKLTEKIKEKVVRGEKRKYYRFRKAKFYGGIATGDCVGCNLSCHFCWSEKPRKKPEEVGDFYSPTQVKEKLTDIARENDFTKVRLSGNEPTIGENHLLSLIEKLEDSGLKFILETNGITIGEDEDFAEKLSSFNNIHVRLSLKGCDSKQFYNLTGAEPSKFSLQTKCLKELVSEGVSCHATIIKDFVDSDKLKVLEKTLREIDLSLARNLEFEKLITYPHVRKNLKKAGIEIPSE